MDTVVIDASLAAMWVLPEPHSRRALSLAGDWAREGVQVIAPCLLLAEVNNAFYKRVTRKEMTLADARGALLVVLEFPFEIRDSLALQVRAMELAQDLRRPATYDADRSAIRSRCTTLSATSDARSNGSSTSGAVLNKIKSGWKL